ncbi:MAG: cation diffusion facilitator family transporter [Maricaulaceae bacterium]|nr:cation diffusion facilitator family transporter [Maricaulaceae bacterium]
MPHDVHTHAAGGPGKLAPQDARAITGRATIASVSVALVLVVAKLAAWLASGSVAILASLADSALDLAASLTTFFAVRYAASPADREHRFGHGKAEALASLAQAVLVFASALYLIYESVRRFIEPQPIQNEGWALAVMLLSIALTAALIWYQSRAVSKTGSVAIVGDRAHYTVDLATNMVVVAGVVLAGFIGVTRADPVIGAIVALWLVWTAKQVAGGALNQLLDRELPDAERARILKLAAADPRILGVHMLRTRAAGPLIHIQFHVDLKPDLTLDAAHKILVDCEKRILDAYPAADILIHPDPEGRAEPHGSDFFRQESGQPET